MHSHAQAQCKWSCNQCRAPMRCECGKQLCTFAYGHVCSAHCLCIWPVSTCIAEEMHSPGGGRWVVTCNACVYGLLINSYACTCMVCTAEELHSLGDSSTYLVCTAGGLYSPGGGTWV
eukprot:scaffold209786_cov22-Tisochrysis_lutea.AAC.1